ncbi:MAG: ABC transporter permease [Dehalococcoidia bacterium]
MLALSFARQSRLAFKSVFPWPDAASYLSNVIVRPIFTVALLSLAGKFALGGDMAEGYVIGGATFAASWTLSGGIIQGFYTERARSTLAVVFTATGSRLRMYLSRGLLHIVNGLVSVAVTLGAAVFIAGSSFDGANWPAAAAVIGVILLSVMCFSLFLGNFAIVLRDWIVVRATGQMLLMSSSGAFVPRDELPLGFAQIGALLPVTHGLQGLRRVLDGAPLSATVGPLTLEALIAARYLYGGYLAFRCVESASLRSGRYDSG